MKTLSIKKLLAKKLPPKRLPAFASVSFRLLAGLLALSVAATQTAFAAGPEASDPPSQPTPPSPTLEVPAGTVIPLTLVSQIKSKSTKVGDTVRAQVAFPVTAGDQVAIPAGTYVEGIITSLTAPTRKAPQPDLQIHFIRLVYANGYVATTDAMNTQASNHPPDAAVSQQFAEASLPPAAGPTRTPIVFYGGEGFASSAQVGYPPPPQLPPLPPLPGPPVGLIALILAMPIILIVTGIIIGVHHKTNDDFLLYDAGWQFQMTLSTPLEVDAGQAIAAAGIPSR